MGFLSGVGHMFSRMFHIPSNPAQSQEQSGLDPAALGQWNQLFQGYTDPSGIAPWQRGAFDQAVKTAGAQFSALDAARGGTNPFTGPQIASSAAQYVVPQFANMNGNFLSSLMQQRMRGTSSSTGPGIGYNAVGSFLSGFGQGYGNSFFAPAPRGSK